MDKETLSNYGWIVICTLVLAVMIALATPFGEYISGAVKSTTQGLFDVSKNAMDSAGINIEGQSFGNSDDTDMGGSDSGIDDSLNEVGLRFGQDYLVKTDTMWEESVGYAYTFYEDGSCKISAYGDEDITEPDFLHYTDTQILPTDSESTFYFNIVDNGLGLEYYDTEETGKMTLVLRSTIPVPETAVVFDEKYVNYEDGVFVIFYSDGGVKLGDLFESDVEQYPAFYLTYSGTRIYNEDDEIEWSVSADGQTLYLEDMVFTLGEAEPFIQYGQKYIYTGIEQENVGQHLILNEDGSLSNLNGDGETTEPGGVKYALGMQDGVLMEAIAIRFEYKGKVSWIPIGYATDKEHIFIGDETGVWTLESTMKPGATFTDGTKLSWAELKSKYSGVTDTAIGNNTFQNCTTLKSIILPETVKTIGNYAFDNCTSLTQVYMQPFDSVTTVGNSAFSNCTALTGIALPYSVTSIGEKVFANCTSLIDVRISPELTVIPDYAFYNCIALEDVTFENCEKITRIGNYAFQNCTAFEAIRYVPVTLTSVGTGAFRGCTIFDYFAYEGTTTQWASVTLGSNWKLNTSLTSISCSDGSLTLS